MNYTSLNRFLAALTMALCLPLCLTAQEEASVPQLEESKEIIRVSVNDGAVRGQVFAMLEDEKAPLIGKVSLTDLDGNTVSSLRTDDDGNFSFEDVKPGKYRAIGVAGDYVGDTEIEVTIEEETSETEEGHYTAIPLAVAPASSSAIFNTYSSLPAASFSAAQFGSGGHFSGGGGYSSGCGSCGGGGVGFRSFGGCGGGCGGCAGGGLFGGGFGRLALIGGALAIPLALSGDDTTSPDE